MGWAHRRPRMACVGSSALSLIDSPRPPPTTCSTAAPRCLEGPLRLRVGPAVCNPPPRRCLGAGRAAASEPAPAPAVPSARRRHARYDYPRALAAAGWRAGLLCPFCRSCGSGLPALVAEAEADTAARARAHQQKGVPECVARGITVAIRAVALASNATAPCQARVLCAVLQCDPNSGACLCAPELPCRRRRQRRRAWRGAEPAWSGDARPPLSAGALACVHACYGMHAYLRPCWAASHRALCGVAAMGGLAPRRPPGCVWPQGGRGPRRERGS